MPLIKVAHHKIDVLFNIPAITADAMVAHYAHDVNPLSVTLGPGHGQLSDLIYFLEKLKGPPAPIDLADPFLIKAFFFRFLDKTEIKTAFEKEIHNIEETLGDLALLQNTVSEQADAYGQFIYRTAVKLFETMQNLYMEELSKMKIAT